MAIVIGADSSTQSVKVEVRDAISGEVLATAKAAHPPTTPPCSEQHPDAWWSALVSAMKEALDTLSDEQRSDVVALSIGGQQHGMVTLDSDGTPIRPAKLWNDTESSAEADLLVAAQSPEWWANACGSVPVAAFTVTKLAWLKANEPQNYARLATVLLPHDEMTRRCVGRPVTDRGDASGTAYWSPKTGTWALELLAQVDSDRDWTSFLPEVLGPRVSAGTLTNAAATAFGLPESVVVGPGTGDNMAAALGIGLAPGDVVISLGTSGTVYAVSDTPTADPSGCVAGFADASGHFLPLVCTLNAMKVTDAVIRLLGIDHQGFEDLVLAEEASCGGLVLLPYLDGERTPNRPDATGVLSGIRSDVSRGQLARAAVEGVVCGLLDGLDALKTAGVQTAGRLFLIGGGSRSAAFRQVVADLAQRPVVVPDADEHVATGACIQAAVVWAHTNANANANANASNSEAANPFAELAAKWSLGGGSVTNPSVDGAVAEKVRAAYSVARG
jgi:xylulokinase